jgi:hypothetical protein
MLELLVCIAIIAILIAISLPTYSRALGKAKQTAGKEAMRQKVISAAAGFANSDRTGPPPERKECRAAFRHEIDLGKDTMIVSEMRYVVTSVTEFRAYWFTLVDPSASGKLVFKNGKLEARDDYGNTVLLQPMDEYLVRETGPLVPVLWSYLSTDLADSKGGPIGAEVMYSDGHVEYHGYPGSFPVCRDVAMLSHRYVRETE